ncbi:hypothetical protein [Clostridium sp. OS1-26]|uniref:hypothetical protein n=1 Tax=Clostridium sp. OS1-26 TaxID=3070681 RepID=UPI0027E1B08B|nr:hypothetical protein [Clostridium sp. OS1-26]WML33273.1 hypothetical protein RCG18_18225 [Clostridium sp. OS1-26]
MQQVYETKRLVLKILDKTYVELVLDYYLRNKLFLEEWEPKRSEEFYTKWYREEQLDKELVNIENGNSFRVWLFIYGYDIMNPLIHIINNFYNRRWTIWI